MFQNLTQKQHQDSCVKTYTLTNAVNNDIKVSNPSCNQWVSTDNNKFSHICKCGLKYIFVGLCKRFRATMNIHIKTIRIFANALS